MVDEEDRSQLVRKSLAEAHLVEIAPDEFPDRIREVKQVAIGHLGELLKNDTGGVEHRSVAHSLGTLHRLEATLRAEADLQKAERAVASTEKLRPASGEK
jgi:hypothetical protein